MHVMTKVTLSIGGVLLLISAAALAIGGASASDTSWWDDDSIGDEYWTGDTSTTFSEKLIWDAYYLVYVEEGYEVDIEIYEGSNGGRSEFSSCEEWDDCEDYDIIPGYDYIGEINVYTSDDFVIEFTENEDRSVDVMIREEKVPVNSLLGMGGGFCGLCCSLLLLMIGGIMALTLKGKPKVQTRIQIDNEMVVIQENPDESLYDQDETA
ncbi:MAG TPA: hypothetical protein QGF70_02940 [Candidatus Thalassarchaeaceae archaeon]|jgi:hypothetical protein|nr:hypothetical protein [Candidatus Thalassarchaeaceae archaeon]HJL64522.1 hypothetical protein [Candidatus Thalassarchaeaceae archaeon]HJO41919.1 hypothetical protein [Candidatus Thalassarchaeaceae archaeon]